MSPLGGSAGQDNGVPAPPGAPASSGDRPAEAAAQPQDETAPAAQPFDFGAVARGAASPGSASAAAGRPETADAVNPSVATLRARFGSAVLRNEVNAGDQDVVYVEPARIVEILRWLREEPEEHYDHLADVTAVDYGGGRPVEVVYQLWSIPRRQALRIKCELPLSVLEIDSATAVWTGADWLEREVYDLFGVRFRGHPNLRRILMPDNYAEGHPLRKDFPLRGRFSRAEQTRRALSQDPGDYYAPGEIGGRVPQTVNGDDDAEAEEAAGESGALADPAPPVAAGGAGKAG